MGATAESGESDAEVGATVSSESLTRDSIMEVLSNQRRRFTIHVLKQRSGDAVPLYDLAEQVACWENRKDSNELSYKERQRVQNALRQFHLPKMADAGFVEFDSRAGTVELTEAAADSNFYVDVLPERGIPWGLYYLGLSGISLVSLAGICAGVPLLANLSLPVWGVFFVGAFVASSLGHFYDNYYRMRLGARDVPPEVEES